MQPICIVPVQKLYFSWKRGSFMVFFIICSPTTYIFLERGKNYL